MIISLQQQSLPLLLLSPFSLPSISLLKPFRLSSISLLSPFPLPHLLSFSFPSLLHLPPFSYPPLLHPYFLLSLSPPSLLSPNHFSYISLFSLFLSHTYPSFLFSSLLHSPLFSFPPLLHPYFLLSTSPLYPSFLLFLSTTVHIPLFCFPSLLNPSFFLSLSPTVRVGNSLFGFSCESLVSCEQKSEIAIHSFPRANHSLRRATISVALYKRRSEECREQFILGYKNGEKQSKTVKNMVKTTNFFKRITRFLRAKV